MAPRLSKLEQRIDSELKALERQTQVFGVAAAIVVALLAFWGVWREHRQHKDYLAERSFFEERAKNAEARQQQSSDLQLRFGEHMVAGSGDMLSKQVENIGKLGAVIGLVRDTFQLHLEREQAQSKIFSDIQEANAWIVEFHKESEDKFNSAKEVLSNFFTLSAMDWPNLTDENQNETNRARWTIEGITASVLKKEETKDPLTFARLLQVMGVTAYYANDLAGGFKHLQASNAIYEHAGPNDAVLPKAYTKHFLGLIEKNWRLENNSIAATLALARERLSESNRALGETARQFLIPITLAEIESYISGEEGTAGSRLDDILERMRKLDKLDSNQQALLVRAHLLRGNVCFIQQDFEGARLFYERAVNHQPQNPYATLSLAQTLENLNRAAHQTWRDGLALLEASSGFRKKEITTRVIGLAWGAIAGSKLTPPEQQGKYWKLFETAGANLRNVAHRVPIFFSPVTKRLRDYRDLLTEVEGAISRAVIRKDAAESVDRKGIMPQISGDAPPTIISA